MFWYRIKQVNIDKAFEVFKEANKRTFYGYKTVENNYLTFYLIALLDTIVNGYIYGQIKLIGPKTKACSFLGSLKFTIKSAICTLHDIKVAKENLGYGTKILQYLEEIASDRCSNLIIGNMVGQVEKLKYFYKKNGFIIEEDDVIYKKLNK